MPDSEGSEERLLNPYDTQEFEEIATAGTILRCIGGSTMHGTGTGYGDRDEYGICIEPRDYVIGLKQFHQYQHRTQPVGERSGSGDLDLTIYSARKWMSLALAGNPNILLMLFAPDNLLTKITLVGRSLQQGSHFLVSQVAGHRALGYMQTHQDRLEANTGRPDLIARYGFDTKAAAHLIRVGFQGIELMTNGTNRLPMPDPWRTDVVNIRGGVHTLREVLDAATEIRGRLKRAISKSKLQELPDREAANRWLCTAYEYTWAGRDKPEEVVIQ